MYCYILNQILVLLVVCLCIVKSSGLNDAPREAYKHFKHKIIIFIVAILHFVTICMC